MSMFIEGLPFIGENMDIRSLLTFRLARKVANRIFQSLEVNLCILKYHFG